MDNIADWDTGNVCSGQRSHSQIGLSVVHDPVTRSKVTWLDRVVSGP